MKFEVYIFLIVVLAGCAICAGEFPSTIERCKVEDEECMVKAWNKYTLVADEFGIPELDLPIANKHYIDKQSVNIGSNLLHIKITFRNVTVLGMSHTTYKSVKGFKKDPKQMTGFELSGFTPYMSVRGRYEGSGKFLLLQVDGTGDGEIQFYNTTFKITVTTKTEVMDGEEYLIPTKVHCDYESGRNHFRFENILNNKEISDGLNKVMNDNQDVFAKETNEPTATSFSKVFKRILTPIFKKHPYRSFFLD